MFKASLLIFDLLPRLPMVDFQKLLVGSENVEEGTKQSWIVRLLLYIYMYNFCILCLQSTYIRIPSALYMYLPVSLVHITEVANAQNKRYLTILPKFVHLKYELQ